MGLINISYNSGYPFSGQPCPFMGRIKGEIDYGERWGADETIVLAGQLTGCNFSDLTTAQLNLISGFSKDYQALQISYGINVTGGLVCWYPFEEGTGITISDLTASQNTGTMSGPPYPAWTGGQVGTGAVYFTGANYIQTQVNNFPTGAASRTLSLWFQVVQDSLGQNEELFTYGQTGAGNRWNMQTSGGNLVLNAGGRTAAKFNWTRDNNWHMFTTVLPAGATNLNQVAMYLDGVKQTSSLPTSQTINTITTNTGYFATTGVTGGLLTPINVAIDDFRVFNRDLSPYEISNLYYYGTNSIYNLYWPTVYVDAIVFPENKYVKVLPYQITLKTYPSGYFSGTFGILDPQNTWDFKENNDGVIEINHNVSARGFNTTSGASNALDNAKNYVLRLTGLNGIVQPSFITTGLSGVLIEQKESVDRLKGVYSINESYIADKYNPCQYGVLRYKIDTQQTQAGFNNGKIEGSLRGGFNTSITGLRSRFSGFDPFSNLMFFNNSGINFNPNPVTRQITEDTYNQIINFEFIYDDNPFNLTNANYDISINSGINLVEVELKGNINGRGDLKDKWARVQNYFQNSFLPYQIANSGYFSYAGTGYTLNPNPIGQSVAYDRFNGVIDFSYRYSNADAPSSNFLENTTYSLNYSPPLRRIITTPVIATGLAGMPYYETTDLGYTKRGMFGINGVIAPKTAFSGVSIAQAKNFINSTYVVYTSGFNNLYLENYNLQTDNKNNIRFNTTWSYESGDVLGTPSNYTTIVNL